MHRMTREEGCSAEPIHHLQHVADNFLEAHRLWEVRRSALQAVQEAYNEAYAGLEKAAETLRNVAGGREDSEYLMHQGKLIVLRRDGKGSSAAYISRYTATKEPRTVSAE